MGKLSHGSHGEKREAQMSSYHDEPHDSYHYVGDTGLDSMLYFLFWL
jgi:hypothetical protein